MGVTITPVWNRYWLYVPNQYQTLPLDELIGGFNIRNGRRNRGSEGLPDNSLRAAGVMEERAVSSRGCEPGWTFPLRVRSTSGLMISCSG